MARPTNLDLLDWDADPPKPVTDVHLRCNESQAEREERLQKEKAAAAARPRTPSSTVAEQRAIAADSASTPEQKQRALDVLRVYAEGYARGSEIYGEDCDPDWKHFEGTSSVMKVFGIFLGLSQ